MHLKDQVTFPNLGNKGRLGNQLFQIAATISTALDHNMEYFFPEWKYNQFLKNKIPVVNDVRPTYLYTEQSFRYKELNLPINMSSYQVPQEIYALDGYFQSRKYFEKHEDVIREQFLPSEDFTNKLYRKIDPLHHRGCAIHVRRGDYVDLAFYHQIKMDYYEKSMQQIERETGIIHFFVFSDDIEWCKENFKNERYVFIFMEGNTDFEDLILMSFCRHQIIANSSFSWWAAFLNINPNKIVIFPEKWFGEVANLDATDLYY